ncbi:MAG: shikimate kinase [Oscillospiraceae bacterium]|nr:shikimate kinase [Oscillospiraceae bacterium]
MTKNLILCGFMGCGKTTVGENLRKKSGMNLIDTDTYIEKTQGMTISEIFEKYGEDYFRDLEHEVCKELSQKRGIIISTGGGALTFQRNVDVLKSTGTVVLIDVPLEVLKERLKNDTTRPLLQQPNKDEAMKALYEKRMPLYKSAADIVIDGNNSPLQVALNILNSAKN